MIITIETAYKKDTIVAEYADANDFLEAFKRRLPGQRPDPKWAGGDANTVKKKLMSGDMKYAELSEKLGGDIANLAMSGNALDMDYNLVTGMLDYGAMQAGNPVCMYGTAMTETDKSPVGVYVDNWISSTMPKIEIARRGVAVLSLVQALSLYRPVITKFASAAGCAFDRRDNIQIIPVPTHPMDLGRASWMLGSPEFTRAGVYHMVQTLYGNRQHDYGPLMGNGSGKTWQATQLGEWIAKRDGIEDYVFLPMMYGNQGGEDWKSDEAAKRWVLRNVEKFGSHAKDAA